MSDGEGSDAGEGDALSTLQAKHRRENRDLQAEVQRLKKAVPKGDNKRKKSVAAEIEQLEAATRARHEAEVRALQESLAATALTDQVLVYLLVLSMCILGEAAEYEFCIRNNCKPLQF